MAHHPGVLAPANRAIGNYMTADTYTTIALGLGILLVVWLVFSVLKKVVGLLFLAGLALGAYMLWNNPPLLNSVLTYVQQAFGSL